MCQRKVSFGNPTQNETKGRYLMKQNKIKTVGRCCSIFIGGMCSALMLSMAGCGERATPISSAIAALPLPAANPTPDQKFAAALIKAELGDSDSQVAIANMYAGGEGVLKDLSKALAWYQKAADKGNAVGQYQLGQLYASGTSVPKDAKKAVELYVKAAAQGNAHAQGALGRQYDQGEGVVKDVVKALELFQKASDQGDESAQWWLAYKYANGDGLPRDPVRAAELFEKAASQGNWVKPRILSGIYYVGITIPRNLGKAFEWRRVAAMRADASSQLELGEMYSNGVGTAKDMVLAYAWANLAVANGSLNAETVKKREFFRNQLSSQEIAESERLSSNWKKGQILAREGQSSKIEDAVSSIGKSKKVGDATAFFVSKKGQAITNHHAVNGCKEIRIAGREGVVSVTSSDSVNDLALLQVSGVVNGTAVISADQGKIRQGDDIVVFGFPLTAVLSSGGNLTPGIISALTGLGNNTNQLQITAPIQPGSSGSPVMNKKGEVVGVVSMKLSDSKMANATGSVGQNVNFAVSGQTLKAFLDVHKVEYSTGGLLSMSKSTADIADEARKWTMVVECWK